MNTTTANQDEPLSVIPTSDVTLVGTLETWPLVDIILWANQSHRTGMLRVGVGLNAGILFFKDGDLFRVELGGLGGEQALLALLSIPDGSFSLTNRDPPARRYPNRPSGTA